MENVDPGYAIIRIDHDPVYADEHRYTVKRVVWSETEAAAEVARLNEVTPTRTVGTSGSTHALIGNNPSGSSIACASAQL